MRLFLEAIEEGSYEPQIIKLVVKSEEEIEEKKKLVKQLMSADKYVIRLHKCRHDEGKPCEMEILERVENG